MSLFTDQKTLNNPLNLVVMCGLVKLLSGHETFYSSLEHVLFDSGV